MKELRRHPRFAQEVVVSFEPADPSAKRDAGLADMPGWLLGLSEGGALLRTERFIPVDTPLNLQLTIGTPEASHIMNAGGAVRWVKSVEFGHPFDMGVEFTRIDEEDVLKLRDYLQDLEQCDAPPQR